MDEKEDKTDQVVKEIAEEIIHQALENDVPVEWLFHRIKGSVFHKTTRLNSDIDFLLNKGDPAKKWYEEQIAEYTRRIPIFGVKKE
jgi:hypothetical protein